MSRVFVDSSVIIESLKGNNEAISLLHNIENYELAINPIVFSEVVYIYIKYGKGDLNKVFDFLNSFIMLDLTEEVVKIAEKYITKFKLLPNDSLILATCKFYGFSLASLDSDFKKCCEFEGINLIGVK
ncbi:Ribonuclease VapC2 [Methanocaldococcus lauensis]|uniref:Ribonuclease VapC2 n=1 Tax=Methanocaldococcus lauensis TaxID=2546128 RepID=A0A8D6SUF5_9EURY|nr:type II toxin-antitoxin system VapC family toxin [Methanocaldococcus lauensis]CAB3288334.1 Ribonuclease VapC2 [Methanocaldococcus lauensis]